jgi:hypothetical protein
MHCMPAARVYGLRVLVLTKNIDPLYNNVLNGDIVKWFFRYSPAEQ